MSRTVSASKGNTACRTKVKTGCITCRIRRIKCDETKPCCQKCSKTGRTCDGYESLFRPFDRHTINPKSSNSTFPIPSVQSGRFTYDHVDSQEIELLNRYFSTKTIFDVKLDCGAEAKEILQASLSNAPIRYAVLSLRALREDLETFGDNIVSLKYQSANYHSGLQQYGMALRGLVTALSSPNFKEPKSALLCCQILMSVEQVRKDYSAMAQHIIRGLGIMHEYRARPRLTTGSDLIAAHHDWLPFLDIFVIKLFAAPCKFADPPAKAKKALTENLPPPHAGHRHFRPIAPDMRARLKEISSSTILFLDQVSQVRSVQAALQMLDAKSKLLEALELWRVDLHHLQEESDLVRETLSTSFLRMFHIILKIILLGTLNSSSTLNAQLRIDSRLLQELANDISERACSYMICVRTSDYPGTS